jgi:hypothetical protein
MATRRDIKRLLKILAVVFVVLTLIIYAGFRAKNLFLGPQLEITSPTDGQVVDQSLVEISGTARNISFLKLNDAKIFTDENGLFKYKLLLSYGYNIISVEADDRFGRVVKKNIRLIYK